jgi:hypothetical protein
MMVPSIIKFRNDVSLFAVNATTATAASKHDYDDDPSARVFDPFGEM